MITDNWSVDVPLALPFTHTLTGAGAIAGVGTIGTTKALAVHDVRPVPLRRGQGRVPALPGRGSDLCLLLRRERHQHAECPVRRHAVESRPRSRSSRSGRSSVQAGATYAFNERWFVDGMVGYTWLKNTTTLSTGQTQPMTLNPVSVAIGRRLPVLSTCVPAPAPGPTKKPTLGSAFFMVGQENPARGWARLPAVCHLDLRKAAQQAVA